MLPLASQILPSRSHLVSTAIPTATSKMVTERPSKSQKVLIWVPSVSFSQCPCLYLLHMWILELYTVHVFANGPIDSTLESSGSHNLFCCCYCLALLLCPLELSNPAQSTNISSGNISLLPKPDPGTVHFASHIKH